VGAWGIAKLGEGKVPIIYAHGFLFQALGAQTFGELGVGR